MGVGATRVVGYALVRKMVHGTTTCMQAVGAAGGAERDVGAMSHPGYGTSVVLSCNWRPGGTAGVCDAQRCAVVHGRAWG